MFLNIIIFLTIFSYKKYNDYALAEEYIFFKFPERT